jgi:hypothetical protein
VASLQQRTPSYLEPNSGSMQKPIEGLPVLALFTLNPQSLKKWLQPFTRLALPYYGMRLWKPTIFLFQSQPRVTLAGVAERFRRQPAELLYVGSIPIPSSFNHHELLVY